MRTVPEGILPMINATNGSAGGARKPAPRLWTPLLDLFSSIWFGITLAVILFVYCSIGSAMPALRQHPWLEMTEFQWFHWWPFNLLIALFTLTMIVATIRRIPLRKLNAGVWMIHTGIVLLTLGSYIYFGSKIEGDAPVFRRQVNIEVPGEAQPAKLVVLPGSRTQVSSPSGDWRFSIQSTQTDWPILSAEDKGKTAYAVNVRVEPPGGEPFVRQLLSGFPQYTEDVLPGKGRAIKAVGTKLVNEDLKLSLDYHPTDTFHVMDTWALFIRRVGDKHWHERPIEGLPRYNDRISSRDQVFSDPHHPLRTSPLDLFIPPPPGGDPLSAARVHATGYLRYAHLEKRWRDGGERFNPVLELSLLGSRDQFELVALDPVRNRAANGNIAFTWLDNAEDIDRLPTDSRALLGISVPAADVKMDVPVTAADVRGDMQPIAGTEFSYRIKSVQDNLTIPGRDRPISVAIVEIKTPEGTFTRWVSDQPELTRDQAANADPHNMQHAEPDARIQMTYRPGSAPIIFAAHPGGLHFVFNGETGRQISRAVQRGETVEVLPGLALRIDTFSTHAVSEMKPFVVPPTARQRDAGDTFAMVRLEVDNGKAMQSRWLRFNRYVFPDANYATTGRFSYAPERFRLADGGEVEVLFGRKRLPLPAPIAMEDFELDTHLGGFTGSATTIRNYISKLRFLDNGRWTDPRPIAVNAPTEFGGFWYFQSTWDRPDNADPGGGMNYTGLGIGNRHGVYVQLAGCCIAVAGMIFAFYIKPVLKRRRATQQAEKYLGRREFPARESEVVAASAIEV